MVQLRGPIVNQWTKLYPNTPFPNPDSNPQVFPQNFVIKRTTYVYEFSWWDQIVDDCCAFSRCCIKGLFDYQCQWNNKCYLNLIQFAFTMIAFILSALVFIIALGFACRWVYKFVKSAVFLHNMVKCITEWMKCFTFGIFDEKVYYKNNNVQLKLTQQQQHIIQKGKQLDIKIVISRLDQYQKQRLEELFQDYQVVS